MHKASLLRMKWFRDNYLNVSIPNKTRILDVGSFDVNGNYKILFPDKKFDYTGLDMVKGPNEYFLVNR